MHLEEAEHMGLQCPTLFIVPAGDTVRPRAAYDNYVSRVPNARMEVVGNKDATHFAVRRRARAVRRADRELAPRLP